MSMYTCICTCITFNICIVYVHICVCTYVYTRIHVSVSGLLRQKHPQVQGHGAPARAGACGAAEALSGYTHCDRHDAQLRDVMPSAGPVPSNHAGRCEQGMPVSHAVLGPAAATRMAIFLPAGGAKGLSHGGDMHAWWSWLLGLSWSVGRGMKR